MLCNVVLRISTSYVTLCQKCSLLSSFHTNHRGRSSLAPFPPTALSAPASSAAGAVEYGYMKKKLKEIVAAKGTSAVSMPPTGVASRTHPDFSAADVSKMMREWARLLEEELQKVEAFTSSKVAELQASVSLLSRRCGTGTGTDVPTLTVEADALANTVIELDKFTRINALALEKIVKKHDKMLQMSTRLWLLARLESAGFTNVKLDGFLVALSDIYSRLRDLASPADEDKKGVWVPPESFERTTTKFWIRLEDVIRCVTSRWSQHVISAEAGGSRE